MSKKYIKNCTGDDCGEKSEVASSFSLLVSKILFRIALVGSLSVTTYVLFFSPYLQITNIEIQGNQELSSEELIQKIQESLQGKYLGVIPKNNFLFVSQKNIKNILVNDFKKIREVSFSKKFPDSIDVNIDERKALLIWCSNEKCYLMDESGTPYSEADFNSPEFLQNHLLKINDTSGRDVLLGEKIIEPAFESYVISAKDELKTVGFEANGEYSTPSRMAEEIRIKTVQGPDLYFSTQFPLASAMSSMATVLKKEIDPQAQGEIEYFDLRNDGKVFYKLKNVEAEKQPDEKLE
jgi:cell division septal protein FtsQ